MQESIRDARLLVDRYPHIHWLENEAVSIGDVRFVGATLWTDFRLNGGDSELAMEGRPALWVHGHVHHRFDYRLKQECSAILEDIPEKARASIRDF